MDWDYRKSDGTRVRLVVLLTFLAAPRDVENAKVNKAPLVELTYNWDSEEYAGGRNFGHLAYRVDDIYALCDHRKSRYHH